jgi:hypothetical protein
MIIENEKTDCIDAIAYGLNRTREWRRKMAIKFPTDPRNVRAEDCLSKLAADAASLTDDDWQRLKPHAGWASETFRDGITQAARSVGFQNKITNLNSYIERLLDVLSQSQSNVAN